DPGPGNDRGHLRAAPRVEILKQLPESFDSDGHGSLPIARPMCPSLFSCCSRDVMLAGPIAMRRGGIPSRNGPLPKGTNSSNPIPSSEGGHRDAPARVVDHRIPCLPAPHSRAIGLRRGSAHRPRTRLPDGRIRFGGYDGVAGALSNQTWAFNFQANAWTNLQPARHPSARSRQGMAFDAQSDRTILFGGLTAEGDYSSETWAYSIDWDSWANMTSEVRPPGRRSPGMVYDAAADRTILFGGYDSSSGIVYNDTWAYDFESNSWTNRNPPAAPSPRFGMGLAYDARLDRSILFGGAEGGDNVTWAYDFTND